MKRFNVIMDVDDVLRDFVPNVLKKYNEVFSDNVSLEDMVHWEALTTAPRMDNLHGFLLQYPGEIFIYGDKTKYAKEVMDRMWERGYRLTVATHQFRELEGFTYTWLQKNNIPYDNLFFGKDKYLLTGDVMVDDKYRNLQKFKRNNPGSLPLLMDKPWNREVPPSYTDENGITEYMNLIRVKDMVDAYKHIRRFARSKGY